MALFDEYFYTNIYHGLPREHAKTIQDNIILLQESSEIVNNATNILSFSSIFTGPLSKAGVFITNKLFNDLEQTKKQNQYIMNH
jgi:hypothetical protein